MLSPLTAFTNSHVIVGAIASGGQSECWKPELENTYLNGLKIKSTVHIQLMGMGEHHRLQHLIETGHKVNVNNSFKVVYKTHRGRMLQFAEALAIRRSKPPPLCPKAVYFLIKTTLVLISLGIEFCSYSLWPLIISVSKMFALIVIMSIISHVRVWTECAKCFPGIHYTI